MRKSLRLNLRRLLNAFGDVRDDLVAGFRNGGDLRKATAGRTGLFLHVGCGPRVFDTWINIDLVPSAKGAIWFNALNGLDIADGAVRRIHCEHFLEHLEQGEADAFLRECARVLETGGTMRVIVPDLKKYIDAYVGDDRAFFGKLERLGGAVEPLATRALVCNQMFRMGGAHAFAWDFETLERAARRAGFSSITPSEWNKPAVPPAIDGDDDWRLIESLFAELVK